MAIHAGLDSVPAAPECAALTVRELRKHYGSFEAVRGITFEVQRGEIFGLLGPNGAGKTSTIEIIVGLREASAGEIAIFGADTRRQRALARSRIGVALQQSDFFDHLKLSEQLTYLGACYGIRPDTAALLRLADLAGREGWRLKQLSGGQKQRFSIAAALVNDPPLIVLDEPSTGLDPSARKQLWALIRELRASGRTVVLSTHYMEEAEYLCDRVAIMDRGLIAAIDSPTALIDRLIQSGFERPVEARKGTLEDVFIQLTGHEFEVQAPQPDVATTGRKSR